MKKTIYLLHFIPFFFSVLFSGAQTISKELIDKTVGRFISSEKNSGMIIGVLQNGTWSVYSYGKMDKNNPAKPDTLSLFEIGASTHVFTTILLADMDQQGILHTDEAVQKFLPSKVFVPQYQQIVCVPLKDESYSNDPKEKNHTQFVCYPDPQEHPQQIMLCDLASYTSGLPDEPSNLHKKGRRGNPYAEYSTNDLYSFLNNYELNKPAGNEFHFSDLGIALLGHSLSLKVGKSYDEMIQEHIGSVLQMNNTKVILSDSQKNKLLKGHNSVGAEATHWDYQVLAPAMALHSNMSDLMKFVNANIHPDNSTLGRAMVNTHNPRLVVREKKNSFKVGLGWVSIASGMEGKNILFTHGNTGGFSSYIGFIKESNTGVIILSNSSKPVDGLGEEMIKLISH